MDHPDPRVTTLTLDVTEPAQIRRVVGESDALTVPIKRADVGRAAAEAYGRPRGMSVDAYLARFGRPLRPRQYGEHVSTLVTDPAYEQAPAVMIRADARLQMLDA